MTLNGKEPKSFFFMKLRACNDFIPLNMMFMQLYPVTLTEWSSIVAVPLDVLKLQLHMLIRGIDCCHNANIIHHDIKPDNVLIGNDLVPKLIDFGMVRLPKDEPIWVKYGTPGYTAPEAASKSTTQDIETVKQVDCWSIGVLIY